MNLKIDYTLDFWRSILLNYQLLKIDLYNERLQLASVTEARRFELLSRGDPEKQLPYHDFIFNFYLFSPGRFFILVQRDN
ncbi:protein of unknown function [Legionella hackeliae]|uniref:Uncharacterized protein n=1 Tax=Legionella hackeliae TaxID=449 RepID=A0A0A8UVF4_LEGHA|nr:protein of unknown function [Legionella hackeliae]